MRWKALEIASIRTQALLVFSLGSKRLVIMNVTALAYVGALHPTL